MRFAQRTSELHLAEASFHSSLGSHTATTLEANTHAEVDPESIHCSVRFILSTYCVPDAVLITFMYILSCDWPIQFWTPARRSTY